MKKKYGCIAIKCIYRTMVSENTAFCSLPKCPYGCRTEIVKTKEVSQNDLTRIKQVKKGVERSSNS